MTIPQLIDDLSAPLRRLLYQVRLQTALEESTLLLARMRRQQMRDVLDDVRAVA